MTIISKQAYPSSDRTTLIEALAEECDPAQLMELCYWSREIDLLPLARSLLQMPGHARAAIEKFLQARDPRTVEAALDADGAIRLRSARHAMTESRVA